MSKRPRKEDPEDEKEAAWLQIVRASHNLFCTCADPGAHLSRLLDRLASVSTPSAPPLSSAWRSGGAAGDGGAGPSGAAGAGAAEGGWDDVDFDALLAEAESEDVDR